MAKLKVNPQGFKKAQDLIKSHHYVLDSEWSEAQPSAERENDFLADHNWQDFGAWHLAIDPDTAEDSKEHYKFPYGDLQRVHRSGLIAAKQRAAQNDYAAIEEVADELLTMIDRK